MKEELKPGCPECGDRISQACYTCNDKRTKNKVLQDILTKIKEI